MVTIVFFRLLLVFWTKNLVPWKKSVTMEANIKLFFEHVWGD
jgi:hypothetical protein